MHTLATLTYINSAAVHTDTDTDTHIHTHARHTHTHTHSILNNYDVNLV